ncbi:MAG: L-glutamate gamma-semialdehyde dehydrogenase [Thermoplasmata archaeon]
MANRISSVERPRNEPVLSYAPGTEEREALKRKLEELQSKEIEIPIFIAGRRYRTGDVGKCVCAHDHSRVLGRYHKVTDELVEKAIDVALSSREEWANMPWVDRAAVFLRAADLLSGPYRMTLNAAAMLCQDKNVFQAEIDSACELIDFLRFNVHYMSKIYEIQPESGGNMVNSMEYRPLEGFVFAVTPFNFASIMGNLPSAPAMMGNVVIWKPATSAVYTSHFIRELFQEAGVPPGVITMLPGPGVKISKHVFRNPHFAGLHFTGSTETFDWMWKQIANNLDTYRTYPRIVGETGGKDFIFAHKTADVDELVTAMIRGAFEYQGQKCSAASRAYIPASIWSKVKRRLLKDLKSIKMGPPTDFSNFVNAVIDHASFGKIKNYIDYAKRAKGTEIIFGGSCDDSRGWFVEPTVVLVKNPKSKLMEEEIFGPVLTVYLYPDLQYEETLRLCDETSPYGLTGSIFAKDREAIILANRVLRNAAGNFYINDKPTGAVVGQQPFGGARKSGTNDKAGSMYNLLRWVSIRTIKENLLPPKDYRYPFMQEE